MIIEVPLLYSAKIVRKRHRRPQNVRIVEMVPMDIPEITLTESTVVVEYPEAPAALAGLRCFAWLHARGHLVRPMPLDGMTPNALIPATDAAGSFEHWTTAATCSTTSPGFLAEHVNPASYSLAADLDVAQWLSDDRDEKLTATRLHFEGGASFVDGVLHVPSGGPAHVLTACMGRGYYSHFQLSVLPEIEWAARKHSSAMAVFPACNRDTALLSMLRCEPLLQADFTKWCESDRRNLANRPVRTFQPQSNVLAAPLDVLRPELLPSAQTTVPLRQAVMRTFDEVGAEIHRLDRAGLHAYADMRDATNSRTTKMDELVVLARRFSDALQKPEVDMPQPGFFRHPTQYANTLEWWFDRSGVERLLPDQAIGHERPSR